MRVTLLRFAVSACVGEKGEKRRVATGAAPPGGIVHTCAGCVTHAQVLAASAALRGFWLRIALSAPGRELAEGAGGWAVGVRQASTESPETCSAWRWLPRELLHDTNEGSRLRRWPVCVTRMPPAPLASCAAEGGVPDRPESTSSPR